MDRSCLAIAVDNAFMEYALVLIASIQEKNPWFQEEVVVLWNRELSPLSDENKKRLQKLYDRMRFIEVDDAPYRKYFSQAPKFLHPAFIKLGLFRLADYDHVVFIDSDILCLGDIKDLFTMQTNLAACPAGKDRAKKERLAGKFKRRIGLNSGVMVIGKRYLNERTHRRILRYKSGPCADQDVLQRFFRWRGMTVLDHRYNYHAAFFWKGDASDGDVRLLHYAGDKPLQKPGLPRMKIWFEAQRRLLPSHV
jgi:lipopolysaccharide biosynthesis glycosyltransferase